MIEFLKWDSDFFYKKIFRVNIDTSKMSVDLYEEIIKELMLQKADGAYVFLSDQNTAWAEKLQTHGHNCLDRKIIFQKKITRVGVSSCNNMVVEYKGAVNKELIDLSLLAGKYSRFKTDDQLNRRFEALYTEWMINSLNEKFADAVLVYKNEEKISGMLTFKASNNIAIIGLIAVFPEVQGRGIGKLLIDEMEKMVLNLGVDTIEVSTQLDNIGACTFYTRSGFEKKSITPIFHVWL